MSPILIVLLCASLSSANIINQLLGYRRESEDNDVTEVCYAGYGCFSFRPPFFDPVYRPLSLLPIAPEILGTRFLLWTRKSKKEYQYLTESNITRTFYNPTKPTKIFIHGLFGNGQEKHVFRMRDNYLARNDVNVISVDWSKGATLPYSQATANTRLVGAQVAKLIRALMTSGASLDSFHIIGHSLGAHTAGYVGERFKPGKVKRITGLDPAEPLFQHTDPKVRLDPSDASFVDVIHSDANDIVSGAVVNGGFGLWQASGHVDFYPNGGTTQPGCNATFVGELINGKWYKIFQNTFVCHHNEANRYFADSILDSCDHRAYECDSFDEFKSGACLDCSTRVCAYMGERAAETELNGRREVKLFMKTEGTGYGYCGSNAKAEISLLALAKDTDRGQINIRLLSDSMLADEFQPVLNVEKYLEGGETFTGVVFTPPAGVADVTGVELSWSHYAEWTKPWTWPGWPWRDTAAIYPASVVLTTADGSLSRRFVPDVVDKLEADETRRFHFKTD